MKSQSIIIQFILFFVISLSVFMGLVNWYNLRKIYFQSYLSNISKEAITNRILFETLKMYLSSGNYIEKNISVPNKTLDYFYTISFVDNKKIEVMFLPDGGSFQAELLGINYTSQLDGTTASIEKIRLIKNGNQINISGG